MDPIGNFFKVNLFRLILLIFMLGTGGSLFIIMISRWIAGYDAIFVPEDRILLVILLVAVWFGNILVPIVVSACGIVSHRNDPWVPMTTMEITGRVFVTLFKTVLYFLGIAVPFIIGIVDGTLLPFIV